MLLRIALLCGLALRASAATTPPLIDYVTYLGGSYGDTAAGIAVDSTGAAYVAGNTLSPDFPVTSTSLGAPSTSNSCAFVTKFNPTGTAIDFSVCLANSTTTAFALDANGNMYLAIVKAVDAWFVSYAVVKLDPTAQNILYTTQIDDFAESMAVDAAGNIYVAGAAGPGLATTAGAYQQQSAGGQCSYGPNGTGPCTNAFVTKLSPSGSVAWSTYLGGTGPDDAHAIAVDSAGNVWVAGETVSPNFPTTASAISRTFHGEIDLGPLRYGDAFISKLDPTGGHLLYSTYLGGSGPDGAFAIAVDSTGAAYVAGGTGSPDFPTTPGALQTTYTNYNPNALPSPGPDGFITKLDASGNLVYSTLTFVANRAIAVDAAGQAYVNGAPQVTSSILPPGTCAPVLGPASSVINASGSALVATSPIPGDYLALDGKGGLYFAGTTTTLVFFSTPHAFETQYGGGNSDAFTAKVDFSQPAGPSLGTVLNAGSLFPGYEAGFPTGAVAPGEIVAMFGNGFGSSPSVTIGTFPAAVLYSSNCQINAVVPFEVNPGLTTLVTVQPSGQTDPQMLGPIKLPVVTAALGIFTKGSAGSGQAAILNQDSTVNSAENPAPRGSIVSVYLTGSGALSPSIADGSVGPLMPPFPAPVADISANIGGVNAPVAFAGQAPGLIAGVTQVNVQVPQNAPVGAAVLITIEAAYYVSQASVAMAVR